MAKLSSRLRRKMSIKKNRFKTPQQQLTEAEANKIVEKKIKPKIKKRARKKATDPKTKRVYKKRITTNDDNNR